MKKTHKIILVVIISSCIFLGLGYAAIQNITLNITGTASADPNQANFKVGFSGTPEVSDFTYATAEITSSQNAKINVSGLTQKGQQVSATYFIKNDSQDLSADLSVNASNTNTEYFTVSSRLNKTSLAAGEETTVTVTVELTQTLIDDSEIANIGITLVAHPVEPGKEGQSGVSNDFSQSPSSLNEYGFYYGEAYSFYNIETDETFSFIIYEDASIEGYVRGVLTQYYPAGTATFSENLIVLNDDIAFKPQNNGEELFSFIGTFTLDREFMAKFDSLSGLKNEYGFYWEEAYSFFNSETNYLITFVPFEDGSVDYYINHVFETTYPAGTYIYGDHSATAPDDDSAYFTVYKNGRVIANNSGAIVALDLEFWDRLAILESIEQ